jgi:hypothetical protein
MFGSAAEMPTLCDLLIHDPARRQRYAEDCFEVFRQRDVRDVIKGFFR